ncbi:MAG: response regulator [Bryobacterales bacterium]|nr:response regulator [Bryobacterales bacterium]
MQTVLVADDEDSLRILVGTVFEEDYRLLEASDGDEALELARAHQPDLLVVDWMMPGKTGVEVTAELRRQPAFAATPIILLTAKSQRDDVHLALASGVTAYLMKPFSPAELLELASRLLAASPEEVPAGGVA